MSNCTEVIVANLSDSQLFSTWKSGIQAEINRLSQLTGPSADADKNTGITAVETTLANYLSCVREKLQAAETTPSRITSLQADLALLENDISEVQKDVGVAKERAELLRNPERKTTVYESWFPLHRPLRTSSALLLIGLSLFMFCLILGFLTYQMGLFVDIGYTMKVSGPESLLAALLRQVNPLTLGILVVAVGLLGGLIYVVSK